MKLPKFKSKAFLAPMSGVSDPALRLLCKELGAGLVVTDFRSIHAITAKSDDITKFIEFSEKERPISVQLFGSDLKQLEKAIKIVEPHFDIIDFNMGCPVPKVVEQMTCSALLNEPVLVRKILRTMVNATKKPVTIKIRSGINKPNKWKEISKIAEEEGVSMITFHPRTVKQGYSGKADWNLIKELKQLVKIPVCGNGDIQTPEDAKRMLTETGCDYVMIGRGAMKNPFIFSQINQYLTTGNYKKINPKQKLNYFFKYLQYAKKFKTIRVANVRMHAMNFSKGVLGGKVLRGNLIPMMDVNEIEELVREFYNKL